MDWRSVLEIGVAALERGWIAPEGLTRAIELFRKDIYNSPRELWTASGLLSKEQAEKLYRPTEASFTEALMAESSSDSSGARYVVESTLNEGGMGRILVCHDRALGRRVAMKALRHEVQTPEHARMLAREARVTGNLEHPSIIPVYDVGVSEQDGPYYVMRLVEQQTLDHVITKLRDRDPAYVATWTLSRLLRVYIQVCQAVHYAHSRQVVHCDLKPSNILLGAFGEVLVIDWGLAYARHDRSVITGGTPAYMAPEQLTDADTYDARTDVFALGGILYRILSLRSPFRGTHTSELMRQRKLGAPPPLPCTVAPADRVVPAVLEEIAMKALESDPNQRFSSVEELASAIESFLEGTREREQRAHRADGLVAQGDELAVRYHETREERSKLATELAALALTVAPWAPLEERRRVWDLEDELAVVDGLQLRVLQESISSYEQALAESPKHAAARSGLARLYADRVERARERRAELDRLYFERLVRQYDDDGILVRGGGRPGWLHLEIIGDVEDITLAPIEERDRQLVGGTGRRLRRSALDAVPAAAGSYLLTLSVSGHRLQVPIVVRGDRETHLLVDLTGDGAPREDEVYIPAGAAALGHDLGGNVELADIYVPAFYIQRFPVTLGTYREFLETVLREDRQRVERLIPSVRGGVPLWTVGPDGLVATDEADIISGATWAQLPVFGVDARCAIEFAQWWSARTGHTYRLPTEHEWEKAARGVDGRRYPWGDRFESIFCKMLHSRPGQAAPEPVGTFALDVSPYGVRDMAGGIADWCTQKPFDVKSADVLASRGGAWCDSAADCAVNVRRPVQAEERSVRLGFRLVREARPSSAAP